jgi:hypothetical protein
MRAVYPRLASSGLKKCSNEKPKIDIRPLVEAGVAACAYTSSGITKAPTERSTTKACGVNRAIDWNFL